ncbi:MAG: transposase [Ktedonobacteraceae bacterium]
MSDMFNQQYLLDKQYNTSANLTARIQLHERFSTNPTDWYRWVFDQLAIPPGSRVLELGTEAKYQKRYPEAIRSLIEDEEHLLTFYAFPPVMHRYIRTTNAIESFFSNVRQRTDQIDAFTTETSCLTIVWAVMQDIHLPKIPVG